MTNPKTQYRCSSSAATGQTPNYSEPFSNR